jgi:undecaprenyl-diphosphatase
VNLGQAGILGVVEGLTEFLPVSSTGHLTVTEGLLGLKVDDKSVTAFTAVIQFGAIVAVFLYFRSDIGRLLTAGWRGLRSPEARTDPDWRFLLYVLAGSIPVGIVGIGAKSAIEGPLRKVAVVGAALILWCPVMIYAEARATQRRHEDALTLRDALLIGVMQCFALIPGVSRSGATISGGLLRGLDRVAATRLSFFLAIPALTAATILELPKAFSGDVGAGPTLLGTVISFVVAYFSIAFLLRFVAHHKITAFVPYRIAAGIAAFILLATGAV